MQDAIHVSIAELGRRVQAIENTNPAVTASQVRDLHEDMRDIRDELRSLRRAWYALATAIAGGTAVVALTAWQLSN